MNYTSTTVTDTHTHCPYPSWYLMDLRVLGAAKRNNNNKNYDFNKVKNNVL